VTERYRLEDGKPCIDLRLATFETLFDKRDPSPFRDRDLDVGLYAYLRDSVDDLLGRSPRLVFWLDEECEPSSVSDAVHGHVSWELERLHRDRMRALRFAWTGFALAIVAITALMSLATFIHGAWPGLIGDAVRESLVISGWVLLWRPMEVLVFDALLYRRERRVLRELLTAPLEVRRGKGVRPPAVVTHSTS
jgi:hypothetical protein